MKKNGPLSINLYRLYVITYTLDYQYIVHVISYSKNISIVGSIVLYTIQSI